MNTSKILICQIPQHDVGNQNIAQTIPPLLGEQSLGRHLEAQRLSTREHFWFVAAF